MNLVLLVLLVLNLVDSLEKKVFVDGMWWFGVINRGVVSVMLRGFGNENI